MNNNEDGPFPSVPPFVSPDPNNGNSKRISQRGLLSLVTMIICILSLLVMLIGGLKVMLDVFKQGLVVQMADGLLAKTIVLGLIFLFGWLAGALSIRVFDNLILPLVINVIAWVVLAGIAVLDIAIIDKLFVQKYDTPHFWAYILMIVGTLIVLVGLHLMLERHDLRFFAVPLLVIAMGQLFVVVFRYVFIPQAKEGCLLYDIIFFAVMTSISGLMLAHTGMLNPLRHNITQFFYRITRALRPES